MRRLVAAAIVLVFAPFLHAQPAADTVVLIPTLYNGPGAFGTTWWAWGMVNNHGSQPFSSAGVSFLIQCPIPEGCMSPEVPAHGTGTFGMSEDGGLLLHGSPEGIAGLSFQVRFGALSSLLPYGAELPAVREHEFRRDRIDLPAVPLHNMIKPGRTTLRIYGPDGQQDITVRIELRHWTDVDGAPLASRAVALHLPLSLPAPYPVQPAFAQVPLQIEFADLAAKGASFNVTVVPLPLPSGETPRIWAFVTMTDNATQLVTVQTPQ